MADYYVIPPGWTGFVLPPRWAKPFGWFDRKSRTLSVWPVAWIPTWFGLRECFTRITWAHEALHAWGNPGCGKPWCLGYEGNRRIPQNDAGQVSEPENRSMLNEYLVMPLQLAAGLQFCDECSGWYLKIAK
jgi:hypothetical protein